MYNVAIIGCGGIFEMHAVSISMLENVRIVSVCDINEERAICKAKKYNCKYYTDYKLMIDNEEIDCVHICTPHYLHYPMAKYALQNKINVVCEKPMALSYADAKELSELAINNNLKLGVVFQNRYNPGSILAKRILSEKSIGSIISSKIVVTWDRGMDYYQLSDWKGKLKFEGGGVIIDQAIHSLDLVRWLSDLPITYVSANCHNRLHNGIDVEDEAIGVFYLGDIPNTFYTVNYYSMDSPIEIHIHCAFGIIKIIGDSCQAIFQNGTTISASPTEADYIDFGEGAKEYWGTSHYKLIKDYYINDNPMNWNKEKHPGYLQTQLLIDSIYDSSKRSSPVIFDDNCQVRTHDKTYDIDNA